MREMEIKEGEGGKEFWEVKERDNQQEEVIMKRIQRGLVGFFLRLIGGGVGELEVECQLVFYGFVVFQDCRDLCDMLFLVVFVIYDIEQNIGW